jgi:hypothetical protein
VKLRKNRISLKICLTKTQISPTTPGNLSLQNVVTSLPISILFMLDFKQVATSAAEHCRKAIANKPHNTEPQSFRHLQVLLHRSPPSR